MQAPVEVIGDLGHLGNFPDSSTLTDVLLLNQTENVHEFLRRLEEYLASIQVSVELKFSSSNLSFFQDLSASNVDKLERVTFEECYYNVHYQHYTPNAKCPHVHGMQIPATDTGNDHWVSSPSTIPAQQKELNGQPWHVSSSFPHMGFQMVLYLVLVKRVRRFISFAEPADRFYTGCSQRYYNRSFLDVQILLPRLGLEMIHLPIKDFCPPDLKDAISALELNFYGGEKQTAMSCTAGFGRTGLVMLMLGLYSDCLKTRGAFINAFAMHHDLAGLREYIDSFYPNVYDPADSAGQELTNVTDLNGRVEAYVRKMNTILYAIALVYLKHVDRDYPFNLSLFQPDQSIKRLSRKVIEQVRVDASTPLHQGFAGGARNNLPEFDRMNLKQLNSFLFGSRIPAAMTQDVQPLREIGRELYRPDVVYGISMDDFDFYAYMGVSRKPVIQTLFPSMKSFNPKSIRGLAAAAGGRKTRHKSKRPRRGMSRKFNRRTFR